MAEIKTQIESLKNRITQAAQRAGRPTDSVRLLAVSKTQPADRLRQAFHYGLHCFGENYLQEALVKIQALADLPIQWHFIGPIQSNKTKEIAQHFAWVQSVDRLKIARRLATQRPELSPPLNVCIQVNIDQEPTKSGVAPTEVYELAHHINTFERLVLRGMMIIPKKTDDIVMQRASFERAYQLFTRLAADYPTVDTLSMGMSGDLATAIEQGSTMVRIGTALFGSRTP